MKEMAAVKAKMAHVFVVSFNSLSKMLHRKPTNRQEVTGPIIRPRVKVQYSIIDPMLCYGVGNNPVARQIVRHCE